MSGTHRYLKVAGYSLMIGVEILIGLFLWFYQPETAEVIEPIFEQTEATEKEPKQKKRTTKKTAEKKEPKAVKEIVAQSWWKPAVGLSFSWQLSQKVDTSIVADVYDVDLFDVPASTITTLKAQGRRVVCYTSLGAWENWRSDAKDFAPAIRGNSNGWAGEKWLDIRQLDTVYPGKKTLRQIIKARMDLCKQKGFDAIEPDNIDGYTNKTGFPLTAADQLAFNQFLAEAAHERGLAIALKNDLDQIPQLVSLYDFAINEQCAEYNECSALKPFIAQGKPVFQVEYELPVNKFCPEAKRNGFFAMKKRYKLDSYRVVCS